jgi:F-box/WD-40 domain protein MET30
MDKKRPLRMLSASPGPSRAPLHKRELDESSTPMERPLKRQRPECQSDSQPTSSSPSSAALMNEVSPSATLLAPIPYPLPKSLSKPWKVIYSERLIIERNWRRGRHTVRTLQGHKDGVMCLQFSETLSHPSFPILITGSYDRTARVWNMETGAELQCLRGHTRAVRALQFDEVKLITGSMDHSIRVWDWRSGRCIRTLMGHTEGVVCLNFDSNVLASGGVDTTVKVWNLRTGEAFILRGHRDWVNSVQLWDSTGASSQLSSTTSVFDSLPAGHPLPSSTPSAPQMDPGKMLFSASDDGTIRLWDLTLRTCVRQFTGHVSQVQSLKLLVVDEGCDRVRGPSHSSNVETTESDGLVSDSASGVDGIDLHPVSDSPPPHMPTLSSSSQQTNITSSLSPSPTKFPAEKRKTILISGSLDNTIKVWDIDTAKVTTTLFGHIEGVWSVAGDELRLVSGSHDRTVKVSLTSLVGCGMTNVWAYAIGVEPRGGSFYCYSGRTSWRGDLCGSGRGQNCIG